MIICQEWLERLITRASCFDKHKPVSTTEQYHNYLNQHPSSPGAKIYDV